MGWSPPSPPKVCARSTPAPAAGGWTCPVTASVSSWCANTTSSCWSPPPVRRLPASTAWCRALDLPVASFDGSRVLVVQFVPGDNLAVWDVATETRVVQNISPPLSGVRKHGSQRSGRGDAWTGCRARRHVDRSSLSATMGTVRCWWISRPWSCVRPCHWWDPGVCKSGLSSGCLGLTTASFTADGRYVVAGGIDNSATPKAKVQIAEVATNTLVWPPPTPGSSPATVSRWRWPRRRFRPRP